MGRLASQAVLDKVATRVSQARVVRRASAVNRARVVRVAEVAIAVKAEPADSVDSQGRVVTRVKAQRQV